MNVWLFWIVPGIILIAMEIFIPKYYLISIGVAAVMTGIFSLSFSNILIQIIAFTILSFVSFLVFKKFGKAAFRTSSRNEGMQHHLKERSKK